MTRVLGVVVEPNSTQKKRISMRAHKRGPLLSVITAGTVATVITLASACSLRTTASDRYPDFETSPRAPSEVKIEMVDPSPHAITQRTSPELLPIGIEYHEGRCTFRGNMSDSAIRYAVAVEKADSIKQIVKEKKAGTLYCLGRAAGEADNRSLAKKFYCGAERVLSEFSPRDEYRQELSGLVSNSLGVIAMDEGKFEEAFEYWRPIAGEGDSTAQNNLAVLYRENVATNPFASDGESGRWFFRSAQQGHYGASANLALLYRGFGNNEEALKWALLAQHHLDQDVKAAADDNRGIDEQRKKVAKEMEGLIALLKGAMTDAQESAATKSKDAWLGQGKKRWIHSGSGFYVNDGHILTNAHVVSSTQDGTNNICDYVSVMSPSDRFPHFIHRTDKIDFGLDLAVFYDPTRHERNVADRGLRQAILRNRQSPLVPGEYVIVTGFPLPLLLASEMHITTGVIVASSSTASDRRRFIFSAPTQSGNSGGPVLDANGSVIGVVTARVGGLFFQSTQNMNIAISLEQVHGFLAQKGIPYEETALSPPTDNNGLSSALIVDTSGQQVAPTIAEEARGYTAVVECWMSTQE